MLNNKKAKQAIGIGQIVLLVFGIVAIGFIVGSELQRVSGGALTPVRGDFSIIDEEDFPTIFNDGRDTPLRENGRETGGGETGGYVTNFARNKIGDNPGLLGRIGITGAGIIDGAFYAGMVYGGVQMIAGIFGEEEIGDALSAGAGAGVMTTQTINALYGQRGLLEGKWGSEVLGGGAPWWGIGVGLAVAALTYKDTKTKTITFDCNVWQPPEGGEHCEECNQQGIFPCSEYQCKSLGQACQLVNKGTEEEKCVWVDREDVEYPQIEPLENVLTTGYKYSPDNTISPPDRGVKILRKETNGCVEAFTPLSFGIKTDEPAQCRVDHERKEKYEDMQYYFGGKSTLLYNHTQSMSLPGKSNVESENLTLNNNGIYELYVRCKDANGNTNPANFVFRYCVEEGPDTTPPMIVSTDLMNNMPVAYNQTSVEINLYTNEPAECKWDYVDRSYKDMQKTMSCSNSVMEMNAQMLYECETTLDGIKNRKDNNFYFRCKDQPNSAEEDRNVNAESYEFTIKGTRPLVITEVGPNGTVKDASDPVKVTLTAETRAGYKEGEATCKFSDTGEENDYIEFSKSHSHEHSQELNLEEGDYKYWIKCIDLGGNTHTKTIEFKVESDNTAPMVARIFKEDGNLKLITDEKASCVYSTKDCTYNFEDGIEMQDYNENEHYIEWNPESIYYIKCEDQYNNRVAPNQCNIIVRPLKIEEQGSI